MKMKDNSLYLITVISVLFIAAGLWVLLRIWTPALHEAAKEGNIDKVHVLLNKGADVNVKGKHGYTALMLAAWRGHIEIVKLLIEKGADINAKNKDGNTALMWAASNGSPIIGKDIVKTLIEKGADINAKNNEGKTALMWAEETGQTEIAKILKQAIFAEREKMTMPKVKVTMTDDETLIPAGDFEMGGSGTRAFTLHKVYLDEYYIDRYPVTVAKYKHFSDATGSKMRQQPSWNEDNHPVIVNWFEAVAYCEWAGKRLPTEAEWEKAARAGRDGLKYPWGNELTHDYANFEGTEGKDKWEFTSPVGSFPPNDYGLYDMVGNVEQWCSGLFDYNNLANNIGIDRTGGPYRVLRGGNWWLSEKYPQHLDISSRSEGDPSRAGVAASVTGFRCARFSKSTISQPSKAKAIRNISPIEQKQPSEQKESTYKLGYEKGLTLIRKLATNDDAKINMLCNEAMQKDDIEDTEYLRGCLKGYKSYFGLPTR